MMATPLENDRTFGETGSSQRGYGCQQPRNGPASPGDLPEARKCFERALKIFREKLGEDHPNYPSMS